MEPAGEDDLPIIKKKCIIHFFSNGTKKKQKQKKKLKFYNIEQLQENAKKL